MSNLIYGNSRSRTDLDQTYETIKFKTLYPTFEVFSQSIIKYAGQMTIEKRLYDLLNIMVGNSFLRFTTSVKNEAFIATQWKNLWRKKTRLENLYNLSQEELLKSKALIQNVNYVLGGVSSSLDINTDYIETKNTQENSGSIAPINALSQLKEFIEIDDPEITFLTKLALIIQLPLQPMNDYGREY